MIRLTFKDISSRTWEHPADRAALSALQSLPGVDILLQKLLGVTTEKSLYLQTLSSAVRVTESQFGKINMLMNEVCSVLDVKERPELFVSFEPYLNASAVGVEKPFVVLNSSLIDTFNDDEMRAALAHSVAHCLSGHTLYMTLLVVLTRLTQGIIASVPLGNLALQGIIVALGEWERKTVLSADRAALLVAQDPDVVYRMLMKLSGGRHIEQMNINEFFLQAYQYEVGNSVLDSVHKLWNLAQATHPFPVLRLVELKKWVDSGEYDKILRGGFSPERPYAQAPNTYTKRTDGDENVGEHFRKASQTYRADWQASSDPLYQTFADVLGFANDTAKTAASKAQEAYDSWRSAR
jgi:Zn-dependent protease with chaperone function